jgi:DNA-binding cell septation regulator SpoVG
MSSLNSVQTIEDFPKRGDLFRLDMDKQIKYVANDANDIDLIGNYVLLTLFKGEDYQDRIYMGAKISSIISRGCFMKKMVVCFVFAFLAFFIVTAYAQNKITAKGMTANQKSADIACSRALDEAQRNAVEQATGVMITSTTNVENFQVKMDRILSESKGFINNYKIISEKKSATGCEVEIEADVSVGRLRDKMMAINLIMARKSKPRVMLVFKDAVAEATMAKYLLDHNFKLVDDKISNKNKEYERLQNASEAKAIRGLAQHYGAEVIITGTVDAGSESSTIMNIEMNKNTVVMTGKVINGDTGEIVTTASEAKSDNKMKGDFKSLIEETSTRVITKLVDDVLENWSKELSNTATVKLVISGLDDEILDDFKSAVRNDIKGVKDIHERFYANGKAEFDLEVEGNAQDIARDLKKIKIGKRKIRIKTRSQNKVEAVLLP